MKAVGYYEKHRIKKHSYCQWDFAPARGKNAYILKRDADCSLYSLKYLERAIAKKHMEKGLKDQT